jgi:hypothetical protein
MITWPDNYYHSSEDSPDKCDPTQLRRAIFIAAAGAYTIASADNEMTIRIISEMYAGSNTRMGIQIAKASDMIWTSAKETLKNRYKRAVYNLEGFVKGESAAMERVKQLSDSPAVTELINSRNTTLNNLLQIQLTTLQELMVNKAKVLKMTPPEILLDPLEKSALKIIPVPLEQAKMIGYEGDSKLILSLSSEFLKRHSYAGIVNTSEIAGLADCQRSILLIKKIVDSEFERESPLEDIMNYFNVLKEVGLMKF